MASTDNQRQIPTEEEILSEFTAHKGVLKELQTSNRFILKRLNHLCVSQKESPTVCPLCKCRCLKGENGSCTGLSDLEVRVKELERRDEENQKWMKTMTESLNQLSHVFNDLTSFAQTLYDDTETGRNNSSRLTAFSGQLQSGLKQICVPEIATVTEKKDVQSDQADLMVASCIRVEHDKQAGPTENKEQSSHAKLQQNQDTSTELLVQPEQTAGDRNDTEKKNSTKDDGDTSVCVVVEKEMLSSVSEAATANIDTSETKDHAVTNTDANSNVDQNFVGKRNKNDTVVSFKSQDVKHPVESGSHVSSRTHDPEPSKSQAVEEKKLKSILKPNFSKASPTSSPSGPAVVPCTEKKYVDNDGFWHMMAHVETQKAEKAGLKMLGGIHTILCIDISESIVTGNAWNQTRNFFFEYISGLEDIAIEHNMKEEYVALTVFGHETGVKQMLTNNFSEIRQAFSALKFGGPTPMFGGLMMAVAAAGSSDKTSAVVNGIPVHTRVIFISDGYPTETNLVMGPDVCNPENKGQAREKVLKITGQMAGSRIRVNCVPVGDSPNMELMELIATATGGKLLTPEDGRKQARNLLLTLHAGGLGKNLIGTSMEPSMRDFMQNIIKDFSDSDMTQMMEILQDSQTELEQEIGPLTEFLTTDLPPLGTRVRRGPDWHWKEQDGYGPGTIVGHKDNKWLWVEWDANGDRNCYCYGQGGQYDILVVDEPRLLSKDEMIAVGCIVKRGPDWEGSDVDGCAGNKGVIIKVHKDGRVKVRWGNTKFGTHRYGKSGKFDLEICNPFEGFHSEGDSTAAFPSPPPPTRPAPAKNKNKNVR